MLVFPSNPNVGDVFAPGPGFPSWQWDGDKWTRAMAAAFTLAGLADVALTDPSQGQVLTWDAADEKWLNVAPSIPALNWLTDVAVNTLSDGNILTWNAGTQRWMNSNTVSGPLTLSSATARLNVESAGATFSIVPDAASGANGVRLITSFAQGGSGPIKLSPGGRDGMTVATDGSIIIPAADNTTLTVMGGPAYTALAVQGAPNALFVAGEVAVMSAPQTDIWLKLYATGGGFIGSNVGNFSWNNAGQFTINSSIPESPWHVGLTVRSVDDWRAWAVNCIAAQPRGNCLNFVSSGNSADYAINLSVPNFGQGFVVNGRGTVGAYNGLNVTGTDDASYACVITSAQTGTSGRGYGLAVRAGSSGAAPFIIWNAAWSDTLFQVRADGQAFASGWNTSSSARYKADVHAVTREHARATLAGLRAVSFRWKERERKGTHYGLIAEEVAQIDANLVTYDEDGQPQSVRYDEALLMLLPLMQELLEKEESHG